MLLSWGCHGIDNPDSPDYLKDFQKKAEAFEQVIRDREADGQASAEARGRYLTFLDDELNSAYRSLQAPLPETARQKLQASQRAWLMFRDSEAAFIDANWTQQNFGSSSSISRHDYRAAMMRSRIEQLLHYLKNY